MPELPEVETVCRGLRPHLLNQKFLSVQLNRANLRFPLSKDISTVLTGRKVRAIERRAKFIQLHLEGDYTLLIHLGMSGQLLVNPKVTSPHDHVIFNIKDGRIVYRDPRRFGFMDLCATVKLNQNKYLSNIGIEPLSDALTGSYLLKLFKNKKSPIKNLLLNQQLIAGLGNIYACEALFEAGIHPTRAGRDIPIELLEQLVATIQSVLKEAIKAGGSSLRDHRQTDGSLGYFQHNFRVYGREGQVCFRCREGVLIQKLTQGGRSSFFCPQCQK